MQVTDIIYMMWQREESAFRMEPSREERSGLACQSDRRDRMDLYPSAGSMFDG